MQRIILSGLSLRQQITISAYMKCVNELKAGNDEFKEAHDSILAKLKALNMPEVDMFLVTYMPALGKSLDELNYVRNQIMIKKETTSGRLFFIL